MANIIPVPVTISVGVGAPGVRGAQRNFGTFRVVPYASTRSGSLEIVRWLVWGRDGDAREIDDTSLFSIMPRKLLWHICQQTFEEEERESIQIVLTLDDETWSFPMCARELEYEQVHYMIDIEGDWHKLTEVALSQIIGDEQLIFAERIIKNLVDFADESAMMEEMN